MTTPEPRNVVITAFGPLPDQPSIACKDIRDQMPTLIERPGHVPVRIIRNPFDYRERLTHMDMIKHLWNGKEQTYYPDSDPDVPLHIDAMILMGDDDYKHYAIETLARRDGYKHTSPDDGSEMPMYNGEKGGRYEGCPERLSSMYDCEKLAATIRSGLLDEGVDVRTSDDAGLMYCEMIFYEALLALHKREEPLRAQYIHVPRRGKSQADIDRGIKVVCATVCGMIDSVEGVS